MTIDPERPPVPSSDAPAPDPPHSTSLVVWNVPSPAAAGAPVSVRVGVQCAHGCLLAGREVVVIDAAGAVIASATLGDLTMPGAPSLCWADVALQAPAELGVAFFSAVFAGTTPGTEAEAAHARSRTPFSLRVEPPPEHEVVVRVRHGDTGAPVERVEVRLGRYFTCTDAEGRATLAVPGGRYTCTIRRIGYDADPVELDISGDQDLEITTRKGETREELEARQSAWENYPWS